MFFQGVSLEIFDEYENLLYLGKANEHSKLVNVLLCTPQEKVLASLLEEVPAKQPTFALSLGEKVVATLVKEPSWQCKSFLATNERQQRIRLFQQFPTSHLHLTHDDEKMGAVRRDPYSWRECYTVELETEKNQHLYLLMILLDIIFYEEEITLPEK